MNELADSSAEFFGAVEAANGQAASELAVELLDAGTPLEKIATEVLAPAQVRVGELWEAGTWSVADEHVATAITETALSSLTRASMPLRASPSRHIAMACAQGERHSLPARMAAAVAGANGEARVTMLGALLPEEQLHRRLALGDIDVLALSCTMPTNLIGAARSVDVAHQWGVPVIAGGSAFGSSPHRARAIGADGWAADAVLLRGALPELAGRSIVIAPEVLLLDAVDAATVTRAHDRVVDAFPCLSETSHAHHARVREDLVWMARSTAAALLTNDRSIVEDLLAWQCRLLRDAVPSSVVLASARLLADTLEQQTASGAAVLRQAAATVQSAATEGP
ncbi:MAG: cobalamin-dependent protein [Propionibacteriales bacterium]|nr:cobalamin-dependent protein [Propionibacteriales bacterium]